MKQIVIVAALFISVLALALWALGVFEPAPPLPPEAPPDTRPVAGPPVLPPPEKQAPKTEPPAEIPELAAPVRVLVLTLAQRPFTNWLNMVWEMAPAVSFQTWTQAISPGMPQERAHSYGLPALTQPPKAADLVDVQVLLVDDFDPKAVSDDFWESVGDRVKRGALGLLIHPGALQGPQLLALPALKGIVPAVPKPFPNGNELPGVFPAEQRFSVTEAGTKHPCMRITPFADWSKRKWENLKTGEKKWGTRFNYPVATVKPGATVLLNVDGPDGQEVPSVILSNPTEGRVLWLGLNDFGHDDPYRDGDRSFSVLRSLVLYWTLWLSTPQ